MNINENDFRGVDLNLLITFLVLYRERSVSLAAQKLFLGQPAVSSALARLRALFDDALFIRTAQGMQPTARADFLARRFAPHFEQIQSILFNSDEFIPGASQRTFTLGMTDWVEIWLMPPLLKQLRTHAPAIRINVIATTPFEDPAFLEQHEVDMVVSVTSDQAPWLRREKLLSQEFLVLWHPRQLPLPAPLSLENYLRYEHLLVTYRSRARSVADDMLAEKGMERRISYTTPHFSSLPGILQNTPVLTTVPQALAQAWMRNVAFCASPPPLALPGFDLSLLWHGRNDADAGRRWLAGQISAIAGNNAAPHTAETKKVES
ncbi:LysR family transcriptional regulator [Sodalis sp. RH22]|uniref:LysR family transcriptional regulator n=1 Tax=unclassified Sodalis (in: enterobacteria) TaxID=2636512 RepID=UPI0039B46C40